MLYILAEVSFANQKSKARQLVANLPHILRSTFKPPTRLTIVSACLRLWTGFLTWYLVIPEFIYSTKSIRTDWPYLFKYSQVNKICEVSSYFGWRFELHRVAGCQLHNKYCAGQQLCCFIWNKEFSFKNFSWWNSNFFQNFVSCNYDLEMSWFVT